MRAVLSLCTVALVASVGGGAPYLRDVVANINAGRYDEAIAALERDGSRQQLLLAVAYAGKGDLAAARREAENFLRWRPDDVAANCLLALILEEQREYGAAAERWDVVSRIAAEKSLRELARKHADVARLLQR